MKIDTPIEQIIAVRMALASVRPNSLPAVTLVSYTDCPDLFEPQTLESRLKQAGITLLCAADSTVPPVGLTELVAAAATNQPPGPAAVLVRQLGLILSSDTFQNTATLALTLRGGTPAPTPRPAGARLQGCATIVTGSAQGFGRGIADELAAQGAGILVADLNEQLGTEFANDLNSRFGVGTARFIRTDVADSTSTQACVDATVKTFGGVDLFVSNAGVLRAGGLDELDEKSFDLVTRVNYTAYFIGVRAVSAVMKLQHRYNPRHLMDIVQINSKSGLEGSKKNFAYAGSKFGAIGLTQSFAMELVDSNIKVNAVCPGNYFDGPLWSDPENGLFVQYLRAGKVPGATTVDDVRRSYLAKIPMRRGCLPSDVARAILYLHDQQYETGQALPVTGGQVMLG